MTKNLFTGKFLKSDERKTEDEFIKHLNVSWSRVKDIKDIVCIRYDSNGNYKEFKDFEYPIEKPENVVRIVAIGDSFTWGHGVKTNDTWPKQLEKKLNNLSTSSRFEVLNFGKGGYNTLDEVETFNEFGLNYNPDMVVLQFYINDYQNSTLFDEISDRIQKEYDMGIRKIPQNIEASMNQFIDSDNPRERLISIWLDYLARKEEDNIYNSNSFEENWKKIEAPLLDLVNITKKLDIKLLIFSIDSEPEQADALERLSKTYNFTFMDLEKDINSLPQEEVRLPDFHLNEKGYDIISGKILEKVIELIDLP